MSIFNLPLMNTLQKVQYFYMGTNTFDNPIFDNSNLNKQESESSYNPAKPNSIRKRLLNLVGRKFEKDETNAGEEARNGSTEFAHTDNQNFTLKNDQTDIESFEKLACVPLEPGGKNFHSITNEIQPYEQIKDHTNIDTDPTFSESRTKRTFLGQLRHQCREFCIDLSYSLRTKIYVIKTSLRRKFSRTREYAGILGSFLRFGSVSPNTVGSNGVNRNKMRRNVNRDRVAPLYHDGELANFEQTEQFWSSVGSPDSLDDILRKEQIIMSRVKRIIDAKRNLQDLLEKWTNESDTELQAFRQNKIIVSQDSKLLSNTSEISQDIDDVVKDENINLTKRNTSHRQLRSGFVEPPRFEAAVEKLRNAQDIAGGTLKAHEQLNKEMKRYACYSFLQVQEQLIMKKPLTAKKIPLNISCAVCYENEANIETLPCKHRDVCSDCFIEIIYSCLKNKQYQLRCALCRQKVIRLRWIRAEDTICIKTKQDERRQYRSNLVNDHQEFD